MKLTFDVQNDFESTYYLPGYDCKVILSVQDGIVQLEIVDDILEEVDDYDYEDDEMSYDILDEEWDDVDEDEEWEEDDAEEVEEENLDNDLYKGENVVGDFSSCSMECDGCKGCGKVDGITNLDAAKDVINRLAEVDTDGVVMKLLVELVKNPDVVDENTKAGKSFSKILNNLVSLLKD